MAETHKNPVSLVFMRLALNSQQPTANSQQPTVNTQQSTINHKLPLISQPGSSDN
ncbi:MAG: hypothetical protein WBA89_18595 [Microcoleus sp.]|uniref:hypothetical protein n=1 Tax=Microcoleus sp. TaxID=44472 RepID=UPI003C744DB6